ncbi:MAG: NAD(P)-binding protein, partial [Rhodomicrobium sp.]
MSGSIGKKAVVIGAGMAGLVAAKALSAHFEHVSILERDALPVTPAHRPGTPQAQHPHGLLAGGLRALDELFPEFEKDLERAGAVRVRMGLGRTELPGYDPFPQRDLGWDVMFMSRPLTEYVTRRRVERQDNIALVSNCRVTKLVASPDKTRVAAIHYEDAEGRKETLAADLV